MMDTPVLGSQCVLVNPDIAANVRDIQRGSTDIHNQQGVQIVQILQHTSLQGPTLAVR